MNNPNNQNHHQSSSTGAQTGTNNHQIPTTPLSEDPVSMLSRRPASLSTEAADSAPQKKKFADEIVIDGKKIFEISSDKLFYTEPSYNRERVSRWSDPIHKKSRIPLTL